MNYFSNVRKLVFDLRSVSLCLAAKFSRVCMVVTKGRPTVR